MVLSYHLSDFPDHTWMNLNDLNDNSRTRIKESQGSRPSNRVIPEKILFYTNSINWENLKVKNLEKIEKFFGNIVIFQK